MSQGLSVALPLRTDSVDGAYTLHKSLKDMAEQNLKMVILTSPGERVMIPEFGVGIRNYLFEPNNDQTINTIRDRIREQVGKYLPYLKLMSLELFSPRISLQEGTDNTALIVKIKYSIPAANVISELTINSASPAGGASGGSSGGGY